MNIESRNLKTAHTESARIGLVDLRFKLRTPSAAIDESAHALLGHLARPLSDSADVVLDRRHRPTRRPRALDLIA